MPNRQAAAPSNRIRYAHSWKTLIKFCNIKHAKANVDDVTLITNRWCEKQRNSCIFHYELCVYVYVYMWIYFRSSLLCLHTLNPFLFYIVCKSHCYQFWALDILRTKCGKCENLCFLLSLLTVRGSIENCCSALCQLPSHCDMDVYHTKKFSYNLMSFAVYTLYEVYRNVCILCVFFVCTLLCVCIIDVFYSIFRSVILW